MTRSPNRNTVRGKLPRTTGQQPVLPRLEVASGDGKSHGSILCARRHWAIQPKKECQDQTYTARLYVNYI